MVDTHLKRILDEPNLAEAWDKVRRNAGMAGIDGQDIQSFGLNVFGRLQTLREQVLRNDYCPLPLLEVRIPKDDGSERVLAVPSVRDRVLQTATARVLGPELERSFADASYAYRAGRSVAMAIARVAHYRDQGYQWVVDTDIQSFFDTIDHSLLLAKLRRTLNDHSSLPLIQLWLEASLHPGEGPPRLLTRGVPQGSPLSPLLANLYLDDMDDALLDRDMRLVRFADDFLILCRDRAAAEHALDFTEEVVDTLRLALKPEKTRITHFEEGFSFLGVDFIRNLMRPQNPDAGRWLIPDTPMREAAAHQNGPNAEPEPPTLTPEPEPRTPEAPDLPAHPGPSLRDPRSSRASEPFPPDERFSNAEAAQLDPLLRSLHLTRCGHSLLKEGERLLIRNKHGIVASLPLNRLDQLIIQGNQLISTALLRHAQHTGLHIQFTDHAGRPACALHASATRLDLQRGQFALENDADHALMRMRAFLDGKLHNQRLLLRRHNRRRQDPDIELIEHAILEMQNRLPKADSANALRGLEGAAANRYFTALKKLIDPHWQFPGRRRQPPTDPLNVLLSYGYGVLFSTLATLIDRAGLNPALGTLHTANGRHPALVSDLMEEFRAPIVDTAALGFLKHCQPADFAWDSNDDYPCQMRDTTRERYLQHLQTRMRTGVIHPRTGLRTDHQRLLQMQVAHYTDLMLGREPVYHPYKAK